MKYDVIKGIINKGNLAVVCPYKDDNQCLVFLYVMAKDFYSDINGIVGSLPEFKEHYVPQNNCFLLTYNSPNDMKHAVSDFINKVSNIICQTDTLPYTLLKPIVYQQPKEVKNGN